MFEMRKLLLSYSMCSVWTASLSQIEFQLNSAASTQHIIKHDIKFQIKINYTFVIDFF